MSEARYTDICDSFDTCALAGAAAFVAGIPKSHILVNGPLWCYFYAKGHLKRASSDIMERMSGSQPDNKAIIFGSADFLKEEIVRLCRQSDFAPSVLFVENSCAFSLIGDDTEGVLKELELPFPSVSMDCGGLVGGFAEGYQKAFLECLKVLRPQKEVQQPLGVNLLGTTGFYLHGKADKEEMAALLTRAGYEVICTPGNGSSWEELKLLSKASLNVVVNEELGLKTAKYLAKELGIPYVVAGLPYGLKGTRRWLDKIAACLPLPQEAAIAAALAQAQADIHSILEDYSSYWGNMWYDEVVLAGNSSQVLCMAEALRGEWLDTGKLTVLGMQPIEQNCYCSHADELVILNKNMQGWQQYVSREGKLLFLGSSNEAVNLMRAHYSNVTLQSIAYPLHEEIFLQDIPLVGINGTKNFLQMLWNKYMQKLCLQKAEEQEALP